MSILYCEQCNKYLNNDLVDFHECNNGDLVCMPCLESEADLINQQDEDNLRDREADSGS